jgi:hypothetical protein
MNYVFTEIFKAVVLMGVGFVIGYIAGEMKGMNFKS